MAGETSIVVAFALFIIVNMYMWVGETNAIFDLLNSGAFSHSFSTLYVHNLYQGGSPQGAFPPFRSAHLTLKKYISGGDMCKSSHID